MDHQHLQLKVMMPTRVVLDTLAGQVNVEAKGGSRGFLPRHIDFVAALATGIISYVGENQQPGFVAVDGGVLVKKGTQLLVSTPDAVHAEALDELEKFILEKARQHQENERISRGVLARLEVALVRRLMELSGR